MKTVADYIHRQKVRNLREEMPKLKLQLQTLKHYNRLQEQAARMLQYCTNTKQLAIFSDLYKRAMLYRFNTLHEIINR